MTSNRLTDFLTRHPAPYHVAHLTEIDLAKMMATRDSCSVIEDLNNKTVPLDELVEILNQVTLIEVLLAVSRGCNENDLKGRSNPDFEVAEF